MTKANDLWTTTAQKVKDIQREYRNYQMQYANEALGYAQVLIKALLTLNAGAFVLLPSYIKAFPDSHTLLMSQTYVPMSCFAKSMVFTLFCLVLAYLTTTFGAHTEIQQSAEKQSHEWKNYCVVVKNKDGESQYTTNEEKHRKKARVFLVLLLVCEVLATLSAVLAVTKFSIGICATVQLLTNNGSLI